MIDVLEYEMPPTLRNARRDGRIFPDGLPNFLDLALETPTRPLQYQDIVDPEGPFVPAPPASMDGARSVPYLPSVVLGSGSEAVSDESYANKFPDEKPFIGKNKRDSRIPLPPVEPYQEPSDPSSDSSVLMDSDDNRKSHPWVRVNPDQDDEISPAPPLWDEEENDTPARGGAGPGAFNPDPASRNTRTIRQRIASARQTFREIVQEDREWLRGAMVRIGIRSEPDGENERPATRRPQPAAEETAPPEKTSRISGIKARVTPYLSLRGGSGTPSRVQSNDDVPPMDLLEDSAQRDQWQDNTRPRGQSQDNTRQRDQSQDNTRTRGQSQDSTAPREERHNSGSQVSEPRPLLSPSQQLRNSFHNTPQNSGLQISDERPLLSPPEQFRNSLCDTPTSQSQRGHNSGPGASDQTSFLPRPRPQDFRHSFHNTTPQREEGHNSGPEASDQRPLLPRPQHFPRARPSEYTHPLVRAQQQAQAQQEARRNQQEQSSNAPPRGGLFGSPFTRPPSRHGYREFDRRGSDPGHNTRNDDVSPRPPSYRSGGGDGNQDAAQDAGQEAGQDASQNVNQNVGQDASQDEGQNVGHANQNVRQPNGNHNVDRAVSQAANQHNNQEANQNARQNARRNFPWRNLSRRGRRVPSGQNAGQDGNNNVDQAANQHSNQDANQNARRNFSWRSLNRRARRVPSGQNAGRDSNHNVDQAVSQAASHAANQQSNQDANQNEGQNARRNFSWRSLSWRGRRVPSGQNAGQDADQSGNQPAPRIPSPVSGITPPGVPPPVVRIRKRDNLSTFGKQTGKKIKETMSKFPTLRKTAPPQSPPPRQIPESQVLEPGYYVPDPNAPSDRGATVHEEVYATNSLTRGLNFWPFNRKKADLTINF